MLWKQEVLSVFAVSCYGPPRNEYTSDPDSDYYGREYPGPFSPTNRIDFDLKDTAQVIFEVYDLYGQPIDTLIYEILDPGPHHINWDAIGFNSGVYFYKLTAIAIPAGDTTVTTQKMILLK